MSYELPKPLLRHFKNNKTGTIASFKPHEPVNLPDYYTEVALVVDGGKTMWVPKNRGGK